MNGRKAKQLRRENPQPKKDKIPTPPAKRSYVTADVMSPGGTNFERFAKPRSEKKVKKFLERFTPTPTE